MIDGPSRHGPARAGPWQSLGLGYALRRTRAVGKGEIKVSKIPLTQGRLGDWQITFGYGEGKVGDRDALLVLTERDEGGGHLTVRVRPPT